MRALYLLSILSAITSTLAFTNPIIWEDLADLDIRNVNGTFYYSASTMHFSPGAPILRSYDLFNWEYIGHSVPSLAPFGSKYLLENGQRAYVNGIWASFFNYHPQQGRWLWGGCVDFTNSWIFSAASVEGPWEQVAEIGKCYYDCGMLVDDDGAMYVSYANNNEIWVAQLAADAKSEVKSQMVFDPPTSIGYLEGTRMYKRNGKYYILADHPSTDEWVLQASSPWGPYTSKNLVSSAAAPTSEGGGNPHQGGLVEAQNGQWYYMAFVDSYPGGRVPVLAPVSWGSDGFPALQLTNNVWGSSYPDPATAHPLSPLTGVDSFTGSALGPQWEWNHVPDTSSFSLSSSGLTLKTATVTYDLYSARNTLTHRIPGPTSTATILLRYGAMLDGDRAGLAMLRDQSGWVGVKRDNGTYNVAMVNNINMGSDWVTINTGDTPASAALSTSSDEVYLRATAEVSPNGPYAATFSYSTDGSTFHSLGPSLTLNTTWEFFMGYRFGIFNYGTLDLGGEVEVGFFQLDAGTGGAVATGVPTTTTSVASATSATKTTTSSGGTSTAVAGHYAQCGGTGYAGPTVCAAGYTCTYSNQYYSQCL